MGIPQERFGNRSLTRLRRVSGHLGTACVSTKPARRLPGPLAGIRVLDLSLVISGPWAAATLADQGADVIKVEPPHAPDLTRSFGPAAIPGMAAMYVTAN